MYGWRARIGILVPATNATAEMDYHKLADKYEGISIHTSRVVGAPGPISVEWENEYARCIVEPAINLSSVIPDIMCVANTAGTFLNSEKDMIDRIEEATGVHTITTAASVVKSFQHLGVKKIGVCTPYPAHFNDALVEYFTERGLEVVGFSTNENPDIHTIGCYEPYVAYELAKKFKGNPDIEGVFISCTDFRAVDSIQWLEDDLGIPVISSNLATFSEAIRYLGINKSIEGFGTLLRKR